MFTHNKKSKRKVQRAKVKRIVALLAIAALAFSQLSTIIYYLLSPPPPVYATHSVSDSYTDSTKYGKLKL